MVVLPTVDWPLSHHLAVKKMPPTHTTGQSDGGNSCQADNQDESAQCPEA